MKTHLALEAGNALKAAFDMQALRSTLTVVSLATALAGCGGGSDSASPASVANDAAVAQAQSNGNAGNPGVMPLQSHPAGKTYAEWSALWWQWAVKRPRFLSDGVTPAGPLNDTDGHLCGLDQSGPVWYLAAGPIGQTRTCHIPAGKFIFFPLIDAEWSTNEAQYSAREIGVNCPLGNGVTQDTTLPDLLVCASALLGYPDGVIPPSPLTAKIDTLTVSNVSSYRVQNDKGTVTLSPDPTNPIEIPVPGSPFGNCPYCVGTVDPGFLPSSGIQFSADGYFLMLAPLSAGTHTLHFQGGQSFIGDYILKVGN